MNIWTKSGVIVKSGSSIVRCATCPCTPPPPPVCPTTCCGCCGSYSVTIAAQTSNICMNIGGNGWMYSYTIVGATYTLPAYLIDCYWRNTSGPTVSYTYTKYTNPDCSGPVLGTGSGTRPTIMSIQCTGAGYWRFWLEDKYTNDLILEATKASYADTCPDGIYNNGVTVTDVTPCFPTCCPCPSYPPASWPCGGLNQSYSVSFDYILEVWSYGSPACSTAPTTTCTGSTALTVTADSSCHWIGTVVIQPTPPPPWDYRCPGTFTVEISWTASGWKYKIYDSFSQAWTEEYKTTGRNPVGSYPNNSVCQFGGYYRLTTNTVTVS